MGTSPTITDRDNMFADGLGGNALPDDDVLRALWLECQNTTEIIQHLNFI